MQLPHLDMRIALRSLSVAAVFVALVPTRDAFSGATDLLAGAEDTPATAGDASEGDAG